ncbi:hypothetical protein D3C81_1374000 [compost metagenome]
MILQRSPVRPALPVRPRRSNAARSRWPPDFPGRHGGSAPIRQPCASNRGRASRPPHRRAGRRHGNASTSATPKRACSHVLRCGRGCRSACPNPDENLPAGCRIRTARCRRTGRDHEYRLGNAPAPSRESRRSRPGGRRRRIQRTAPASRTAHSGRIARAVDNPRSHQTGAP